MLSAQVERPPKLKHSATARNRLMLSRFSGMTCALHAGGDRGNAGNLVLFADEKPILVETPKRASLPLIDGIPQLTSPGENAPEAAFGAEVCPADFETQPERDLMSVDLTHAWPASLGARSIQRTAMVLRRDGTLRLVDAFELPEAAVITFLFHTPVEPRECAGGLRLGGLELTWDGNLTPSVTETPPISGGASLYRIALTTPAPAARSFHTFYFNRI
jgi:hypothetical protein